MEVLGRLAGAVIHDLNNLLTVIQLNAGLIGTGALESSEVVEAAGKIDEASCRAAELTRKVLNFARGRAQETEDVHLQDLVTGLTRLLEPLMAKKVSIAIGFGERDLWVHANRGAVEQAVMNLVLNAVDAMPAGGTLVIAFLERPAVPGSRVKSAGIMVRDQGEGIPHELHARIFEPFFTTKDYGNGMGLAIVDRIVRLHRGTVEFESAPGAGATFTIWLPEATPAASAMEVAPDDCETSLADRMVLLVEDDPGILALATHLLKVEGLRVLPASTGEEAWNLWQEHRVEIQLLFTDIMLPGEMSGSDLARKILAEQPGLPVLYTSGYSNVGLDQSYLRADNFLQKPFAADALPRAVKLALTKSSLREP